MEFQFRLKLLVIGEVAPDQPVQATICSAFLRSTDTNWLTPCSPIVTPNNQPFTPIQTSLRYLKSITVMFNVKISANKIY